MAEGEPRRTRALVGVEEAIGRRIQILRGERVLLDADLADLYGVKTKRLNEAVRRNGARFPADFMFQLSAEEARNLATGAGAISPTHLPNRAWPCSRSCSAARARSPRTS